MHSFTSLILTALLFGSASAQQTITQCQTAEKSIIDSSGKAWIVCPNSDYHGNTIQVVWQINSQDACVAQCASKTGCNKAVWDKLYNACHLKADSQEWVTSANQFDTVRLDTTSSAPITDRQAISKCLRTETTITDDAGGTWTVCPNSDYWGNTIRVAWNVASLNDCQKLCVGETGCAKAVFDKAAKACHLKVADGQDWRSSTSTFDTVRLTSVGAIKDRQPIIQCLRTEYNITDSSNGIWTVCPNSDFLGNTIRIAWGVGSMTDCQSTCSKENFCQRAVFDAKAGACHLKGDGQQWASSTNTFDTVRRVSGSSGSDGQFPSGWICNSQRSVITTSDGSTWSWCTNTDWQGASVYAINNFNTAQSCAEACVSTPICSDAVWDKQNKICHMKAKTGLTQANNNQFDQLRLIKRAPPVTTAANVGGKWSDKIVFPLVPAAAYVVPEQPYANRIMAFSAAADYSFAGSNGQTQFATWNYGNGQISHRTVQNTGGKS